MQATKNMPAACFAPMLTDEKMTRYESLISAISPGELKDAMLACLSCVKTWWELPESKRTDGDRFAIQHRGKDITFQVTPLEKEHVIALDPHTPWMRELNTLSTPQGDGLFDSLTGELRDCAFHLLWHCKEITLDREPLTMDKLS